MGERIERENQILLRKILDCHHGVDRGRTSTIPRLPERFSGQDSSRLAGGGGPGRVEQAGQQGREDGSGATGGEETDRSTSTALTSAGTSTDRHSCASWR